MNNFLGFAHLNSSLLYTCNTHYYLMKKAFDCFEKSLVLSQVEYTQV